jgi:hypothetical protein
MNLVCWLLGHKWRYNFVWMPNKRTCVRCGRKEKGILKKGILHPLKEDPMKWIVF